KNKKIIIYIFSYIFLYSIITIIYKDINILPYELKQTINTFYLPITLITFIDMFKQYNINFKLNYIIYIYITYITFILLPNLTNTSFQSYSHSKLGNIGWFQSANSNRLQALF
ncbi:MAG: O-antigen ligase family protein, partial [Clostridia bacterium]|nr:O-antigen ligase family protein [Clostridia bacterium]